MTISLISVAFAATEATAVALPTLPAFCDVVSCVAIFPVVGTMAVFVITSSVTDCSLCRVAIDLALSLADV